MQELSKQLRELRDAKDAGEFIKKEELAYAADEYLEKSTKKKRKEIARAIESEQYKNCLNPVGLEVKPRQKLSQEELDKEVTKRLQDDLKIQTDDFKSLAYELLDGNSSTPIEWVDNIPRLLMSEKREKRLKAKKLIINLIKIASLRNIGTWETTTSLKRQVTLTKTSEELQKLQKGVVIQGYQLDSLEQRFTTAATRELVAASDPAFTQHIKDKEAYLNKKGIARRVALGLNGIVNVAGVGLISSLAFISILPPIFFPLAIGLGVLGAFAFGYTEGFVFFDYVRKVCREVFLGFTFFQSIDHKILNREAENTYKKRDRHLLTQAEIDNIYADCYKERVTKKILAVFAFLVSLAVGYGYMGLLFTEIVEFLGVGLLASMPALIAIPWVIAGIVAPIYAIVMFGMLYKAIKDNYFMLIINRCYELFSWEYKKKKYAEENPGKDPENELSFGWHVVKSMINAAIIAVILSLSVVAIVAVGGLWIKNITSFANTAIGFADHIAEMIGYVISSIYIIMTVWFCVEKSLSTVQAVSEMTWGGIKESFKESCSSFTKFLKSVPNLVMMLLHFAGSSVVAWIGARQNVYQAILPNETARSISAVVSDSGSEIIIDSSDTIIKPHLQHNQSSYDKHNMGRTFKLGSKDKSDKEGHHHSHANIVKTAIAVGEGLHSAGRSALVALGICKPKTKVAPVPLSAFKIGSRA